MLAINIRETLMDINFKILQSKYFNDYILIFFKYFNIFLLIKIFALKNFKINIHENVSRAFNILHYKDLKCFTDESIMRLQFKIFFFR